MYNRRRKNLKFDIPISISVDATTEPRAVLAVFDFLKKATKEYGIENRVIDWEYFEFIAAESSSAGCGNNKFKI